MKEVMEQAQKLAEAIVDSDIYQRMHKAELAAAKDEAATQAIAAFVEKRQSVESCLADNKMDHEALARAGEELDKAEKSLNEIPVIKEMQDARKAFTDMMGNVNQLLRLVITGETEESGHECTGECGSCGGCH